MPKSGHGYSPDGGRAYGVNVDVSTTLFYLVLAGMAALVWFNGWYWRRSKL